MQAYAFAEEFLFISVMLKILTECTASACYGQELSPVKILLDMLDFTHLSAELL